MDMRENQYNVGLDKNPANFVPLSPLSFLERSAAVYPDLPSAVYEGRTFTWAETYARCRRFASYLAGRGIGRGDTVAAMLPNIPAMNEAHFAVPMTGGVLAILFSCLPEAVGRSKVFKMMARNDFGGDRSKLDESIEFEDRVMDEDLAVLESYRHTAVPLDTRVEVHTRNDKLRLAYRRVLAEMVGAAGD